MFGIFATVDSSYILALLKPAIPEFPLPTQDNTRTFTAVSTNVENGGKSERDGERVGQIKLVEH